MTEAEFHQYLEVAVAQLREKQEALTAQYNMGRHERWFFDQNTGTLRFFDGDTLKLAADVLVIGSYAAEASTWKWAWANDSILPALRQQAEALKALGPFTGFDLFEQPSAFDIDPGMEWEMAAFAVHYLQLLGCYRVPSLEGARHTFLGIKAIKAD